MSPSHAAAVSFVIGSGIVASLSAPAATFHPRPTQVTWSADVGPIVQRRCAGCHVAGGFGPMPLTRFEDARDWSRAISERAMEGTMPPWPAAAGIGDFSNDRSLTPIEIELLAAWAEGGAVEGSAAPPPARVAAGGTADFVRYVSNAISESAAVMRFEVPAGLDGERWITGWAFEPREPARVDRAVLGVAGAGRVSAWVPPETTVMFPAGVARRLSPRATLTVDVHYRKGATPPAPGGRVSLYFGAPATHELRHTTLPCGATTLDETIDVLAIEPATTESGAVIEAMAKRPDQSMEPLILVPRFVTWYVPTYRFRSAVRLPRGSRVVVRSSAAPCTLAVDYVPVR